MYSEIVKIGPITIQGYGLMIGIGIACALFVAGERAKSRGLSPDMVYNLAIVSIVFGFIGAKLLYVIVEARALLNDPLQVLSGSGFVVYGGIIGGILAALIYCKVKGVSFLHYFDLTAPSISIAQGFGRIGCLLAGCCYGCETDSIIGIVFRNSLLAPNNVKLMPTQIISSAGNFLIAAILLLYARKERKAGKVGLLYLILYSVGRFIIEFFRNDYRGSIAFLSTSQFISLLVLIISVTMFFMDELPWADKWSRNL